MTDPWRDPTAAGAVYADPTAPVFIAPLVLPEPDPVYRDDALFASASANWRPAPVPPPPVPVLDESGELILVPAPTPAMLRDQAVAALKAPPAHYQAPASRGGARSTYTAEPPPRPSRRPGPARPQGSVTSSPSTWLPDTRTTPTAAWRQQSAPVTYLPQTPAQTQAQTRAPSTQRAQPLSTQRAQPPPALTRLGGAGPVAYRPGGRARGTAGPGPGGRRRGSSKGWIPGLVVLAFIVLANVVPHLKGAFHRAAPIPAGVNQVVNTYYTDLERGDAQPAAQLVCSAQRPKWLGGIFDSDLNLEVTGHTITSTASARGGTYTVNVHLVSSEESSATLTVVREKGAFRICGGTGR